MQEGAKAIRSDSEIRIVIAGGGTGGHLYPGLAIAEAIKSLAENAKITFIGTHSGLEARVVPEEGYDIVYISMRGLLRRFSWQNLLFPFRLGVSILQCMRFFRQFQPHLVLGTGGYVSGPALMAARYLHIPRAIQEQNRFPGLVNRRLGHHVNAVFLAFEGSRRYFQRQPHLYVFGNPVRLRLLEVDRPGAYQALGLKPSRKTVLIFGGSQGAKHLNEVVARALDTLLALQDSQFIWIVGPLWYEKWKDLAQKAPDRLKIFSYVKQMSQVYVVTDLAVCRAGATTIAELALCGIPAIYVPLPFATANHQLINAKAVVQAGAGELIEEKHLTPERLGQTVRQLVESPDRLKRMAEAARSLAKPDAARDIAKVCLDIAQGKKP